MAVFVGAFKQINEYIESLKEEKMGVKKVSNGSSLFFRVNQFGRFSERMSPSYIGVMIGFLGARRLMDKSLATRMCLVKQRLGNWPLISISIAVKGVEVQTLIQFLLVNSKFFVLFMPISVLCSTASSATYVKSIWIVLGEGCSLKIFFGWTCEKIWSE